ncbi:MAG: amidohydrolase [Bacteroidetes bacterium]|nr:amidohydrolase [Bacteroidota bacterium]
MDNLLRVGLIQTSLAWEDADSNRKKLGAILESFQGRSDVAILPEMFTTGFSMEAARLAEAMDGPTLAWMQEQAARGQMAVTGSFICVEEGRYYNRLLWVEPSGAYHFYNKRHLFGLGSEDKTYQAGDKRLVVNWKGWNICPLVCYDLRFPVWSRNAAEDPYDLLVYLANWPQVRAQHWRSLLIARAIENQAFVAAVNLVGTDGKGLVYQGDSTIIDFSGQPMCQISHCEGVFIAELSMAALAAYRKQLPFLKDGDTFRLL